MGAILFNPPQVLNCRTILSKCFSISDKQGLASVGHSTAEKAHHTGLVWQANSQTSLNFPPCLNNSPPLSFFI